MPFYLGFSVNRLILRGMDYLVKERFQFPIKKNTIPLLDMFIEIQIPIYLRTLFPLPGSEFPHPARRNEGGIGFSDMLDQV